MNIYIGFGTSKVKCTQYGFCGQVTFKNVTAEFFGVGWGGHRFSVMIKE